MTSTAAISDSFATIDTLAVVNTVTINAARLRAGMVLVDEFNCPVVGIDHRVKATPRSGEIAFLTADLEASGWNRLAFHPTTPLKVMAK